jgi:hypothetical protein
MFTTPGSSGKTLSVLAAALLLGGVACTPSGGTGGPGGGGNTPGTGGSRGNGSGGSSGMMSGGSTGTGMMTGGAGGSSVIGPGGVPIEAGRVTIRRLNKLEYDNTVRDLLGLNLAPSKMFDFVDDEWGDGFNNDADVLSLSPLSIEKYLTSAQFLIDKALDPAPANAAVRNKIMVCAVPAMPEADCGRRIIGDFAKRAFRKPASTEDVNAFFALIDVAKKQGDNFEAGIKVALAAVLVAPDFLFRAEIDPTPGTERALDNWELASRLSYFVWASMPDDELFQKAEQKALTNPQEIARQIGRMLGDGKTASGFTQAMVEQWMQTVELRSAEPDVKFFPTWQIALRDAMEQEVRATLGPILTGMAPAQDLVGAKYVYANRALAQFYGLSGAASVPADRFEKVMVTDDKRGGVLRGGNLLVGSSHPDTHSPTRRGKWILERLLCEHPPPPPAMVPSFQPTMIAEGTLRQKLERVHVSMGASCNVCHSFIDPMGFALEHYDGAGAWRDQDNRLPVDATGIMPGTMEKFDGAAQLSALIAKDPRLPACMAKQFLTYGLGRKMGDKDQAVIQDLGKKFMEGGYKVPQLVELVAQSPLMTRRQAEKD